jgi:hypothetical protein
VAVGELPFKVRSGGLATVIFLIVRRIIEGAAGSN